LDEAADRDLPCAIGVLDRRPAIGEDDLVGRRRRADIGDIGRGAILQIESAAERLNLIFQRLILASVAGVCVSRRQRRRPREARPCRAECGLLPECAFGARTCSLP